MASHGWNAPATAAPTEDEWKADTGKTDISFSGPEVSQYRPNVFANGTNVSKHDVSNNPQGQQGGCYACGEFGHFARECPNKEDGGQKMLSGKCKICGEEGHFMAECRANRLFAEHKTADVPVEVAWEAVNAADKEKDIDGVKEAVFQYAKAYPDLQLKELEQTFRAGDFHTFLIAKTHRLSDTYTIVNFQGEIDQKYVVSFQFSNVPRRPKLAQDWPKSAEENMERLEHAGFPIDRKVPKCDNCGEMGHISKTCPAEKVEKVKPRIMCTNCDEEGHRHRDCPKPRKSAQGGKGCKNCGKEGHIAKECPEPPNPDNVECRNCGTIGHFSRDCPAREVQKCRNCDGEGHMARECPEPKNMSRMQCRNCDEYGHDSRGCPKPTDWSRVTCTNCQEKGHSYKRCKKPAAEDGNGDGDGGWGEGAGGNGGNWGSGDTNQGRTGGW